MASHNPYTITLSQEERRNLEEVADRPPAPGDEPAASGISAARTGAKGRGAAPASPRSSQPKPAPAVT